MEIIDTKEKYYEFLRFVKNENKKKVISRFCFAGETYHNGHLYLINKIKDQSDILIADYSGHSEYLLSVLTKKLNKNNNYFTEPTKLNNKYKNIINNFNTLEKIDYLVLSKYDYSSRNFEIINNIEKNLINFLQVSKSLNISNELLIYSMCILLENPLEKITHISGGIKNLCVVPIIKKLFPEFFYNREQNINKIIVYELIKDNKGHVISRTRYNKVLSNAVIDVIYEIKKGKTKSDYFFKILKEYKYYLKNPILTILDFNNGDRLDEINDNCAIIFMSGEVFESIYILNGKLIY